MRGLPAAALEELFRSFHSIKGLSGMVQLRDAELLAHHMESYLRLLRNRETPFTAPGLDGLINGTSLLERVIAARRSNQPGPSISSALAQLDALAPMATPPLPGGLDEDDEERSHAGATPLRRNPTGSAGAFSSILRRNVRRAASRSIESVRGCKRLPTLSTPRPGSEPVAPSASTSPWHASDEPAVFDQWVEDGITATPILPMPEASAASVATPEDSHAVLTASHFVRVDLARLDELMRMIGNLVILRARLADSLARRATQFLPTAQSRAAAGGQSTRSSGSCASLREGVMRVRLVPVGEIFRRMPFVVRDLARDNGRSVNRRVERAGHQDRQVPGRAHDGSGAASGPQCGQPRHRDSARVREAAGKPPAATLRLSASSSGETVVIEVADDGRGIDVASGRASARGRSVCRCRTAPLDNATLLESDQRAGFSTRDASDRVSGRGFGMNVVRETLQELGGTMPLETEPGQGTRFVIELPLTLAITAAMLASRRRSDVRGAAGGGSRSGGSSKRAAVRALENH